MITGTGLDLRVDEGATRELRKKMRR